MDQYKQKADLKNKVELLREIHKMEIQIQTLERERATHIFCKRSAFRAEFSPLDEINNTLTNERKADEEGMCHRLMKIKHSVRHFQRDLFNVKPSAESVARLRNVMEEVEESLYAFKEEKKQRYEELLCSERTIQQELQTLEKKIDSWSHVNGTNPAQLHHQHSCNVMYSSAREIAGTLPPEVASFEKFIQQYGGHNGGWDDCDHSLFLKFRNKYKGRREYMEHLKYHVPTRSEEEIGEHDDWYQEYVFLNERRKDCIKMWREVKEAEKVNAISKALKNRAREDDSAKKDEIKEGENERRRQESSKLNAWKVQKELERITEEERRVGEQVIRLEEEDKKKKLQAAMRAKVEEVKQQRQEEETRIRAQAELREREEGELRQQEASREIVRFQIRDHRKLQERLAKQTEKEEQELLRQNRLENTKLLVEVVRDPARLLQPTAGWESRLQDKSSSDAGRMMRLPHRAVPTWRRV